MSRCAGCSSILANDVRRHLKAPLAILIFMVIPLAMTGLIGIIFAPRTEGNELPPIPVLLVDNDKGLASKLLLGAFDADQMKKMFQVTVTDEAEGRQAHGEGQGLGHGRHPRAASPSTCSTPSR